MKKMQKKGLKSIVIDAVKYILISSAILLVVSLFSSDNASEMGGIVQNTMGKIIQIMVGVSLIIGLIQVWLSPKQISKWIGSESGIWGMVIASTFPMILGGSMLTMFPLMLTLREKGVPNRVLIAFLVAWAGKVPLLPLETEFLGINFAIIRILVTIPMAIILGTSGEFILNKWDNHSIKEL